MKISSINISIKLSEQEQEEIGFDRVITLQYSRSDSKWLFTDPVHPRYLRLLVGIDNLLREYDK